MIGLGLLSLIYFMFILVGGFKHEFYFPFHIWDVIRNPLTNSYFSEGWLIEMN